MSFSVPIVLLVFNRPAETRAMFEEVRRLRPDTLLIVADGPRPGNDQDVAKCAAVRDLVTAVDWPCQVSTDFADSNMGLQKRVTAGLNWVFERVDRAIILEDDCVADPSFFPYCQQLLEHYADDSRVMSISGNNFQFGGTPIPHSYYFSRYMHCWGWATWRRAWRLHDATMPYWGELKTDGWLESFITDFSECRHFHEVFDEARAGTLNSWATQWSYTILRQNGLNIHPAANLVSNIGFSSDGSHTQSASVFENLPRAPMTFPLTHPPHPVRNFYADANYARLAFRRPKRHFIW